MSPSLPASARVRPDLGEVLRALGPAVQRGSRALRHDASSSSDPAPGLSSGIEALDLLLGGGLAPGRLCELSGPPSSGRTSLALALLARATEAGEVVGVVDAADAFHPASAAAAGVQLERVLWVRPPGPAEALRCCERLLQARGFAAVLLDGSGQEGNWAALPTAAWQRLVRAGAATRTALLVLSQQRVTGSFADLALGLQPSRACFSGAPLLFEGLETRAEVTRLRGGPLGAPAPIQLRARGD